MRVYFSRTVCTTQFIYHNYFEMSFASPCGFVIKDYYGYYQLVRNSIITQSLNNMLLLKKICTMYFRPFALLVK